MRRASLISFASAFALLLAGSSSSLAQGEGNESGENRFLLTGYGFATYTDTEASESFDYGFAPIFLYRIGQNILFEAELEFEIEDDEVETEVEYAQVDWFVHDRATLVAGKYLTPFGSFIEKLHPAWINKLPTAPLAYQHGASLVPFGQTGIQLRGGIPIGDGYRRMTYSVFLSNGFRQTAHGHGEEGDASEGDDHGDEVVTEVHDDSEGEHGDEEGEDADELIYLDGSSANGNGDLALGGRVAVLPAQGFEIGVSYMSGSYDDLGRLDASMRGLDFAYHHELFDLRAEWLETETERGPGHDQLPQPDQELEFWYVQPSLRLSLIPVYAFNKLELVARLANLDWGAGDEDQISIGLNYYFTSSSIVRVAWERRERSRHPSEDTVDVMFAVGF